MLRSVAFLLKKILFTKCNYNIYNKELIIIIRIFEK